MFNYDEDIIQTSQTHESDTVQRNAEFDQLKTSMGKQHGVDTSALQSKHNSSFPGQVGAAATLQGSRAEFGPGQSTKFNMKHEIGHYIINAKRGTPPKADTTVNGFAVNTTDEVEADKMAAS